jgi:hypothetical protein
VRFRLDRIRSWRDFLSFRGCWLTGERCDNPCGHEFHPPYAQRALQSKV